jgi:hypothetical protein
VQANAHLRQFYRESGGVGSGGADGGVRDEPGVPAIPEIPARTLPSADIALILISHSNVFFVQQILSFRAKLEDIFMTLREKTGTSYRLIMAHRDVIADQVIEEARDPWAGNPRSGKKIRLL